MKKTVWVLSLIVMLLSQVFSPFAYAVSGEEVPIPEPVVEEVVPEPEVGESEVAPEVDNSTGDNNFEEVEPSTCEVADLVEPVDVEVNTGTVISTWEETKNLEEKWTEASSWFIEKITETIKDFLWITWEENENFESKEIYWTWEYGWVKVEVYAQTWLFASWTELTIEPVVEEKLQAVQEVLLSWEVDLVEEKVIAFDITFRDPETQEELQPKNWTVQVKFNYEENDSLVQAEENAEQEVKVYHLNDIDEEWEKIEEITWAKLEEVIINEEKSEEENVMVVEANSFSIYTIVQQVKEEWPLATEDQLANFVYGEISIEDPNNPGQWITIMDRNLWAITNDVNSTWSYWYLYQWWNSYGFNSYSNLLSDEQLTWDKISINQGQTTYSWSVFYSWQWTSWASVDTSKLRRWNWPCPEWWHVPSSNEWTNLLKYYVTKNYDSSDLVYPQGSYPQFSVKLNNIQAISWFIENFKIPYAWFRNYWGILDKQNYGFYFWSKTQFSRQNDLVFSLKYNWSLLENSINPKTRWYSVRCFKDTYSWIWEIHTITFNFNGWSWSTAAINVVSWEKAKKPSEPVKEGYVFDWWYSWDNVVAFDFENTSITWDITLTAKYLRTATIVWDDDSRKIFKYWTIQIWDYVLMDRNLWAKKAWDGIIWEDNSSNYGTDNDYYGYYYQWWNNWWFSDKTTVWQAWSVTVNDGDMPSKYSRDIWSTALSWNSENNLWWDEDNTHEARKWPCPEWWHVPSKNEWQTVYNTWINSSNKSISEFPWEDFAKDLKLPPAGRRYYNNLNFWSRGSYGDYWSSTPDGSNSAYHLYFTSSSVYPQTSNYYRSYGFSVRCLKNYSTIIFYSWLNETEPYTTQIVEDWWKGVFQEIEWWIGYEFLWWYEKNGDEYLDEPFDFTWTAITGDIELYAKWKSVSTLIDWYSISKKIENLVDKTNVETFTWSGSLPDDYVNKLDISKSWLPVYIWYNPINKTIYYHWDAELIYMNENSSSMFSSLSNLISVDLSHINMERVVNIYYMFSYCRKLKSVDFWNFVGESVVDMHEMFEHCEQLESIDLSSFVGKNVKYMYYMFAYNTNLTYVDLQNFVGENVIAMRWMFSYDTNLMNVDLSNFVGPKVENIYYMFDNCDSLINVDLGNFVGSNVTETYGMFSNCDNLKSIDLHSFVGTNVTTMYNMFKSCWNLETIDLSSFNPTNLNGTSYFLFENDYKLKTIYVWNSFAWGETSWLFWNDASLVWWYWTKYNSSITDRRYAKIDTPIQSWYFTDPNNFAVAYYTKQETPSLLSLEWNKKIWDHPNWLTQSHTTYNYYTWNEETTPVNLSTIDLKAYTELYVNITCDSDDYWLIWTTCYEKHPITVAWSWSTINVTSVVKDKYLSWEQVELTVIWTPDGNISWSSTPSIAITSTNSGHTISFTMPDSNITLTPSMTLYHKVTYHVTSNGWNATENIVREKLVAWDPVDLTLTATKTDYSFEWWNTVKNSHETLSTLTMWTANIDLYPIFKKTISATFSWNWNTIANQQSEVVEECYRYNVEPTCSVVVPVIDNNAYTSIISWYSMNAATWSEIATIGTVTLDAATVAWWTASIDISDDITLYAQTYEQEVTYTVTYQKWEWDDARGVIDFVPYNDSCIIAAIYNGNNNVEQATGCEVELPTISIATWYHTPLWYKQWEDTSYSGTNIILTWDIILEAKVTANNYTVVYKPWEWTWEMESQEFEYDKEEGLNKNKYRKEWYHFSWWIDMLWKEYRDWEKVLNLLTEWVLELTAQWLQNPPAAWWGQSIIPAPKEQEHNAAEEKLDDKQESNQDKQQDETVKDESKTPENTNTSNQTNTQQSSSTSSDNSYKTVVDPEIQSAYEWAYERDVTTIPTLDEAMPDGVVKRGHLAKMVVNYATNVLWREIPEKIPSECRWNDWRKDWESEEIKDYAVKSCALWLMWLDMPKFLPNMQVTRAQFGTIMSRLLWWKKYAWWTPYYRKHLNALKENGIMTQIDNPEKRVELRQWVWLMLMRSAQNK